MRRILSTTTIALLFLATNKPSALGALKLSDECAKVRGLVLPNPNEATFRTISWRTSVLQGIVEAQKSDRPVMIYLMNGHPLGCT